MVYFAPIGPHLVGQAGHVALVFVGHLAQCGGLFRSLFQHFAQLVLQEAGLLGKVADLFGRDLFALVDAFAVVNVFAAAGIWPDVARVNAERSRADLLHDLNLVDRLAHAVCDGLPRLACAVGDDRALNHAGAKHGGVVDHFAQLAVVVALNQLIFDLGLHGHGLLVGHIKHGLDNVTNTGWLPVLAHDWLALLVHGHLVVFAHAHQLRAWRGLYAPIAVVGWQQNVCKAGLGSIGLLARHANEHRRAVGLGHLRSHRVALLHAGHHLTGRLGYVVFAVVLVLVLNPTFVNAVRATRTNPFVTLATKRRAEGLQLLSLLAHPLFWVFVLGVGLL